MGEKRLLKRDLFGEVWLTTSGDERLVVRDTHPAPWWTRWLVRHFDKHTLARSYLAGEPMHVSKPADTRYFKQAARLLRRLHSRDVTHNDLAKEPNLLVTDDGAPAFIDYQLAAYSPRRGRLFRAAAREDIRHLLKHKRTYCPEDLTARERAILDNPSPVSRAYMTLVKPAYLFVTRRLLGWSDREGAGDRGASG